MSALEVLESRQMLHSGGAGGPLDAVETAEHLHVFGSALASGVIIGGLVPDPSITDRSVASGPWSSPNTWSNGVPKAGDNVLIATTTTVTVDGREDVDASGARLALHAIRIDGTLNFSTTASTKLLVDTIIIEPKGSWVQGTAANPIPAGVTSEVSFADGVDPTHPAIDTTWDPYQFSRGLVSHGSVSIHGSEVASFYATASTDPSGATALAKGATEIALNYASPLDPAYVGPPGSHQPDSVTSPQGWKVGDRLVITGDTQADGNGKNQDQQVAYKGIDPKTGAIQFSPALTVGLTAPAGASLFVSDVTRNVFFASESVARGDLAVADRGHVMFMHNPNVNIDAAGFYGLGRTDKRNPIDDVAPVEDTLAEAALAANPGSALPADDYYDLAVTATGQYSVDAQGNPIYRMAKGKDGKPLLDANGNPVRVVMTTDILDSKTGLRVMVPVVDSAGRPIPLYGDGNGHTVPVPVGTKAPSGYTPLYQLDADGKPLPVLDQYGKPVLNKDGTPQYYALNETQVARSGLNPRGRYAVHFHRTGTGDGIGQGIINDAAVVDSPGWGIVNHSSNVLVSNNTVFNATGAAYATEAGDEIGSFVHNIAIHSQGSGAGIEARSNIGDFGHEGVGFWLQGGNVSLVDNIASGQRSSGFVFFPVGLNQAGLGVTQVLFDDLAPEVQNAMMDLDPTIATRLAAEAKGGPEVVVPDGSVPLRAFRGNVAFADGDGLETWFSQLGLSNEALAKVAADSTPAKPERLQSVVSGSLAWNTGGNAFFDPYTNALTFQGDMAIGKLVGTNANSTAFNRNDVTRNLSYVDDVIEGYGIGINVPVNGVNAILGGTFDNLKSIYINTANDPGRVVKIGDNGAGDPISFPDTIKGKMQFDIFLQSNFNPRFQDISTLFNPDVIRLGTVLFQGQQLYYNEQAAGFVPFPAASAQSYVPAALIDKTNAQLFAQYGLAIGGIVAPSGATTNPKINGLLGPSATYPTPVQLLSAKYTQFASTQAGYTLSYKYYDPAKKAYVVVKEAAPRQLVAGWNILTFTDPVDGPNQARSVLVFGDNIAPMFELDASVPLIVNRADVDNGSTYSIQGKILDNSFGSKDFKTSFKLNDPAHVKPAYLADGKTVDPDHIYITFQVSDNAGNKYTAMIELTVSDTAILLKDLGRKDIPNITPSTTLIELLLVLDPHP